MRKILSLHSQEQKKISSFRKFHSNNSGSSLVSVLVAMALILVLITITLSTSAMNFYMKVNAEESKANFYDAESALEELRMGLASVASKNFAECYLDVMRNYQKYDTDKRTEIFNSKFCTKLANDLRDGTNTAYWEVGTKSDKNKNSSGMYKLLRNTFDHAEITTPSGSNLLNFTTEGVVIKNLRVKYTDPDMYVTEIETDLVLAIPNVNFSIAGAAPDLINYTIVANDKFDMSGQKLNVVGSAYLGKDASKVAGTMRFDTPAVIKAFDSKSNVILGGKSEISRAVTMDEVYFYGGNVHVAGGGSITGENGCEFVVANDLVIGDKTQTSSFVTLNGKYYGTGSGISADDSSAIIINSTESKLDLSGLDTMYIGGVSYVNINEENGVMMGESISIKPDQRAYLVPAECVAPDFVYGGVNPMTNIQYKKLILEILKKPFVNTDTGINNAYQNTTEAEKTTAKAKLVDYSKKLSVSSNKTLADFGVTGIREATYQATEMKYLFMDFDSVDNAEAFFQAYYDNNSSNAERLDRNLNVYTGGTKDPTSKKYVNGVLKLPTLLTSDTNRMIYDGDTNELNFFFRGSLVTTDKVLSKNYVNTGYLKALQTAGVEADMNDVKYTLIEKNNENNGLNAKLSKDYMAITALELSQDVFTNLTIDDMSIYSNKLWFCSLDGEAAYVERGNITSVKSLCDAAESNAKDVDGNTHPGATLNVIICDGDVVLDCDFDGLILCSGEVKYAKNAEHTCTANPTSVMNALSAERADKKNSKGDNLRAADFLKDSDFYVVGGSGSSSDDDEAGAFGIDRLVKYANWKKL